MIEAIHLIVGLVVLAIFVGAAFAVAIGVICDPGPKDEHNSPSPISQNRGPNQ